MIAVRTTSLSTIPALSQSKQALMACPHLYVDRVIRGVEEPENVYARRGTEIHDVVANYINHLVKTRQPSDYQHFDELTKAGFSSEAVEILQGLRETLIIDPEKVLGTELYLALDEELKAVDPLDEHPAGFAWSYEGTLDFVQVEGPEHAEIFDWKSYWQVIDADTFQSKLYPLLLFKHYDSLKTIRFHLQFVRYGVSRSVEYSRADVPMLEELARNERRRQLALHRDFDALIRQRDLEAVVAMPGAHCGWCPKLTSGCPIAEINPYTNQSAEDRVRFGIWAQAAVKENTRDTQGPGQRLRARSRCATPTASPYSPPASISKRRLPIPVTRLPVHRHGQRSRAGVAKLTLSGLSTPLKAKKRAALAEQLAPHKSITSQTRFSIKGIEEDDEAE
jgi:hypothetical protein